MAQIIKKNESVQTPAFKNGVSLQFFTITFPSDVSSMTSATAAGVRSPVVVAIEAVQQICSVEVIGAVAGNTLHIAVAALGGFVTTATVLDALVKNEGSFQGVNLANATVTDFAF
jgi:hypothetical protein